MFKNGILKQYFQSQIGYTLNYTLMHLSTLQFLSPMELDLHALFYKFLLGKHIPFLETKKILQLIGLKRKTSFTGKICRDDLLQDDEHPSVGIFDHQSNLEKVKHMFTKEAWKTVTSASKQNVIR